MRQHNHLNEGGKGHSKSHHGHSSRNANKARKLASEAADEEVRNSLIIYVKHYIYFRLF